VVNFSGLISRVLYKKNNTPIITTEEKILGPHPFRNELMNQSEMIKAMIIPINGARTMKLTVLITIGELITLKLPACAMAAPAKPPINVWEDEEGMPDHQVSKFQIIAAISPEKITSSVIKSGFTVLETAPAILCSVKMKKATKLNRADHNTAWKGVRTLVETTVAMELAAS